MGRYGRKRPKKGEDYQYDRALEEVKASRERRLVNPKSGDEAVEKEMRPGVKTSYKTSESRLAREDSVRKAYVEKAEAKRKEREEKEKEEKRKRAEARKRALKKIKIGKGIAKDEDMSGYKKY